MRLAIFFQALLLCSILSISRCSVGTGGVVELLSLPAEMFSFDAPRLRSVSFTDCTFDNITTMPFFRDVTHFCCVGEGLCSSFSVDELFVLLQQMPSLTHLKLDGCLPGDEGTESLEISDLLSREVDVLHLSHLTLGGSMITCAEIIGAIRTVKPLMLLDLCCKPADEELVDDRYHHLLLPEIIAASLDVDFPIRSLCFDFLNYGRQAFMASRLSVEITSTLNDELGLVFGKDERLRRDDYPTTRRGFSLEVNESILLTDNDVEEFMQALLRSLPLENVEMLSFGVDFSPTLQLFLALSNRCRQLQHVRLYGESEPDFVFALGLPNSDSHLTKDYLFPQLHYIILDNLGSVQSFMDHLRIRKDAGIPIQTLGYSDRASMRSKHLRKLAEIIPEIYFSR